MSAPALTGTPAFAEYQRAEAAATEAARRSLMVAATGRTERERAAARVAARLAYRACEYAYDAACEGRAADARQYADAAERYAGTRTLAAGRTADQ